MNFFVNDILSLSQINSSKFRKNISMFDLKSAISEVIAIQKHKAEMLEINLESAFENFSEMHGKILICTDELRLQ